MASPSGRRLLTDWNAFQATSDSLETIFEPVTPLNFDLSVSPRRNWSLNNESFSSDHQTQLAASRLLGCELQNNSPQMLEMSYRRRTLMIVCRGDQGKNKPVKIRQKALLADFSGACQPVQESDEVAQCRA